MAPPLCALLPPLLLLLPLPLPHVWAGGGPGPPLKDGHVAAVPGMPQWLHCTAPNPNAAMHDSFKEINKLKYNKNYNQTLHDYDDYSKKDNIGSKKDNQKKNKKNPNFGKNYDYDYDDYPSDQGDAVLDNGYGKRRRDDVNNRKKHPNKKLEKKQLDLDGPRRGKNSKSNEIESTEPPINYVWYHNDTEIRINDSKRFIYDNGTLLLRRFGGKRGQRLGFQDTGVYRCLANSTNGATISTSITLNYAFFDNEYTGFYLNETVNEGDAIKLKCSINSYPEADIVWEKDSKSLPKNDRYYIFPSGVLVITNSQKDDSGKYSCIANNWILKKEKRILVGNISVIKSDLQSYNLQFVNDRIEDSEYRNVTALYGESVSLGCAVKGRPKPKVIWNFQPDDVDEFAKEITSMEILKQSNLTERHSGLYTCIATNKYEKIQQSYRLEVLQTPYFNQIPVSTISPMARTVRFNCSAGGNPLPNVSWFKDGKPLSITGRVKFKATDKRPPGLIISDTIGSDKGVYQCFASNLLGEVEARGSLLMRPSRGLYPPTSVQCQPISPKTIRVSWDAPAEAVAYTVHYVLTEGGEEISHIQQSMVYDLPSLEPYKGYDIYVKIYQKHGASEQSAHVICHGQGVPFSLYSYNSSIIVVWEQSKNVKQWQVQWRNIQNKSSIFNATFPANVSEYIVEDTNFMEMYEFRVLASPTDVWLNQNLSEIKWILGNKSIITPYSEDVKRRAEVNHNNYLDPLKSEESQLDWDSDSQYSARPTNVIVYPTGPRTINVTWRCDTAVNSPYGYLFLVCHHRYDPFSLNENNPKYKEICVESDNEWIEIKGLDPNTSYAFKVQSVMQSQHKGSPFSETIISHTNYDVKSSITNVRWSMLAGDAVKISWNPTKTPKNNKLSGSVDNYFDKNELTNADGSQSIYTVFYTQDIGTPVEKWASRNVTNTTQIELKDINVDMGCYVMVSLWGEEKGAVIAIPPRKKSPTHDAASDSSSVLQPNVEQTIGIILGTIFIVLFIVMSLCVFIWQSRKRKHSAHNAQASQIRTNRVGRSDFECQEFVSSSSRVDFKNELVYINGITRDTKGRGVGEPLLNGHVNITENPRYSSKKLMPNGNCKQANKKRTYDPTMGITLDVSRYDEFSDVTTETILGSDITLEQSKFEESDILDEESNVSILHGDVACDFNDVINPAELVNGITVPLDRNSNSEISNINKIKESLSNDREIIDSNACVLNVRPEEIQNKENERGVYSAEDFNSKNFEGVKKNTSLDAVTTLGSRWLVPTLGPNG